MSEPDSFDPLWETKYAAGHQQRYPWDIVVSFVMRNAPRDRPRAQVRILEVGCGTGANLWFAAREGFAVTGIDGSASAILQAQHRFEAEGLRANLQCGNFTLLPFPTDTFDLVIDRAALTCCGTTGLKSALGEIARCLRPGGRFLFNPYADSHSSRRAGKQGADDLTLEISAGSLFGAGQIRFVSRADIEILFPANLVPVSIQRLELSDMLAVTGETHSEWRITAEKKAPADASTYSPS